MIGVIVNEHGQAFVSAETPVRMAPHEWHFCLGCVVHEATYAINSIDRACPVHSELVDWSAPEARAAKSVLVSR
jgi:hypothetical protein